MGRVREFWIVNWAQAASLRQRRVRAARARRELVGGIGVLKKIIINH